ncbi:mannitol-1-phosphate 5-dehydrogenase [Mycoplasma putrefaciens]|uniref:Mannitol-1-phosphate 5-dehydrogenase n=1 Tax=Mycoplasma putrefaciens (strain ATCC 15718 / NCTC 10155 / C30 KS-1 / KS-1) TaxID=743965 RepID=A0A7U3ZSS9_MYCPK|nr:mannitol-1-phosphate 5-dehydrogenase [Mycoplasma putrefaciens]AEM68867.1 mannitol-1-phosphate 5-dehydrogenase [Mycoplasma putrefaciens KS1]
MNVIHFGAGNIGRGFIAPILKDVVNHIYFVDNSKKLVDKINNQKIIEIWTSENKKFEIRNISAWQLTDFLNYQDSWDDVGLVTISIGVKNLSNIICYIQQIINYKTFKNQPLVIMCCENGIRVSSWFKTNFYNLKANIYFVDVLVDRIVSNNDLFSDYLKCEDYYLWVVDQTQWPSKIPQINHLTYTNNFDLQIAKKLYMLNAIHCCLGWFVYKNFGFDKLSTVYDALKNHSVLGFVNNYLDEVILVLNHKYQLSFKELNKYKKQIIERLNNNFITDELVRLVRNSELKLSKNERILTILDYARLHDLKHQTILLSYQNGLNYLKDHK